MSNRFESEIKQRLKGYEEEPRKDLWSGIAPHIASRDSRSISTKWVLLLPVIMSVTPLLISYLRNHKPEINFEHSPQNPVDKELLASSILSKIKRKADLSTESGRRPIAELNGSPYDSAKSVSSVGANLPKTNQTKQVQDIGERLNQLLAESEVFPLKSEDDHLAGDQVQLPGSVDVKNSLSLVPDPWKETKQEAKADATTKTTEAKKTMVPAIKKKQSRGKTSLYAIAMPTFGYQRIESNQNDNIIIESIKRVPAFSTKRLGVRAEIGVEYKLAAKLKAFGGLLYYQRKQTINFTEKQVDSLVIYGENGNVIIDPVFKHVEKSIEYELKNVGIQAGLNYHFKKKIFLHTLGAGVELHKPMNRASFTELSQGFGQKPDYYVFYNLYYRLQYPNEGRLKAVFQPSLNYSLYINENLNAPFYVKPYGLGLHVGCTYSF